LIAPFAIADGFIIICLRYTRYTHDMLRRHAIDTPLFHMLMLMPYTPPPSYDAAAASHDADMLF